MANISGWMIYLVDDISGFYCIRFVLGYFVLLCFTELVWVTRNWVLWFLFFFLGLHDVLFGVFACWPGYLRVRLDSIAFKRCRMRSDGFVGGGGSDADAAHIVAKQRRRNGALRSPIIQRSADHSSRPLPRPLRREGGKSDGPPWWRPTVKRPQNKKNRNSGHPNGRAIDFLPRPSGRPANFSGVIVTAITHRLDLIWVAFIEFYWVILKLCCLLFLFWVTFIIALDSIGCDFIGFTGLNQTEVGFNGFHWVILRLCCFFSFLVTFITALDSNGCYFISFTGLS